jgi:hypothetical protein
MRTHQNWRILTLGPDALKQHPVVLVIRLHSIRNERSLNERRVEFDYQFAGCQACFQGLGGVCPGSQIVDGPGYGSKRAPSRERERARFANPRALTVSRVDCRQLSSSEAHKKILSSH